MEMSQKKKLKLFLTSIVFFLGIVVIRDNAYADEADNAYVENIQYGDYLDLSTIVGSGYDIKNIDTLNVTSYQVSKGRLTSKTDSAVVETTDIDEHTLIATGIGQARIELVNSLDNNEIYVDVTVSPAKLTLMYVTGQSNAEGWCPDYNSYNRQDSIPCQAGKVYSSYFIRNE